jgi:hypothetical protein
MRVKSIFLFTLGLLCYIISYFSQLLYLAELNLNILFLARVLLAGLGAAIFLKIFLPGRVQAKEWTLAYFIVLIPLTIIYLLKPSHSEVKNVYMTIHRLITTPVLAVIIIFANKYQNKHV